MNNFVKKHKTLLLSVGFLVLFGATVSYATPPTSPYNAGDTLDPGCAPGSTNCTVTVSINQYNTVASGTYATAFGDSTVASGNTSVAFGKSTKAESLHGAAFGRYNAGGGNPNTWVGTDPLFEIGNGSDNSHRDNAVTVLKNGNVGIGTTTPTSPLSVGSTSQFQVNSSGAIAAATGITSSGTITFSGLTAGGSVQATAGTGALTVITNTGTGNNVLASAPTITNPVITNINPGADFTITQNSVIPFTSVNSAAVANTLVLKNGKVGIGTATPAAALDLEGDGAIIAVGTYGSGTAVPNLGAGTRMMWIPSKGVFRAGGVIGTEWNSANVGDYSSAFGVGSTASGYGSVSFQSIASGNFSFAFGGTASGSHSFAFDQGTASGGGSIAFGQSTSSGLRSFSIGQNTEASGDYSFAMGLSSTASGAEASIAMGYANETSGRDSVSIGDFNTVSSIFSFAIGSSNTIADLSNGDNYTFGSQNDVSGSAMAIGFSNIASGYSSTAFGSSTTASGGYSSSFGFSTTADSTIDSVFGQYNVGGGDPDNWVATDPLFEIGNGSSGGSLSNALTILKNGNTGINMGTGAPSYSLQVGSSAISGIAARFENSTGTCDINPTTASLVCSSDMNLKNNITNLSDNSPWNFNTNITADNQNVLGKILALNPVNYNWKTEPSFDSATGLPTTKHPGFIAQEVREVFPDLVSQDPSTNLLSLNYTGLIPYTIEAVKEMNLNITNIDDLTKTNSWRDALLAWFGNVDNGITDFFSKKITTDQLCVKDANGETCLNRAQVDQIVQQQNAPQGSSSNDSVTVTTTTDDQSGSQSPEVSPEEVTTPDVTPVPQDTAPDTAISQ